MCRLLCLALAVAFTYVAANNSTASAEKHALLIGCSKYPLGGFRELVGAENDVEGFQRLLKERFRFDDVTTLVGWPENASLRPTFANISGQFERLIKDAKPDSQIIILMAGHGFQFPLPESQTDVLDPTNPEPDGKDEAFLAADYHAGQNMILDNQIGSWLDQLKAKGAHVWIIFDSCFSGTMMRGGTHEDVREITAEEAGVSLESLKSAERRAERARTRAAGKPTDAGFDLSSASSGNGSVVAFYAAQDYETAPEVTRPIGEDTSERRFKHGLLSFHLERLLRDRSQQLTYADLGRALVSQYRSDGRRRPTPAWEGDLNREVLGLRQWPSTESIFLEHAGDVTRLRGGELSGLTTDCVVAVYQAGDKEFNDPIGHLRVTEATSTSALVEAVAFGDQKSVTISQLPDNAVCRIVSRPFGETRIKLGLESLDESLTNAIREKESEPDAVFRIEAEAEKADWILMTVPKPKANSDSQLVLLPAEDARLVREPMQEGKSLETLLERIPHARFSGDAATDPTKSPKQLIAELRKLFAWHNIWRLAGEYAETSPLVTRQEIQLDVRKLEGADDQSSGQPIGSSQLRKGDSVLLRVANKGYDAYWYVVFYLNGRYGIQHVETKTIRGRNYKADEKIVERDILRFTIDDRSIGSNGFVVIAVSLEEHANQPDYRHLTQSGLGKPSKRASVNTSALTSPFERVLLHASGGRFRSSQKSPDNPQIASWSWVTSPPASVDSPE